MNNPSEEVPAARSRIMKANKRRDTKPEMRVRSLLHSRGLRYRVDLPIKVDDGRPIRPDIVFSRPRIAVFIDGCYWHGCPVHATWPKTRTAFWREKIERNRSRDVEHGIRLTAQGWTVMRFWEHEPPTTVAEKIADAIRTATDS